MSQGIIRFDRLGPLEWKDDDKWGLLTGCGRFAVMSSKVDGKVRHVLWAHGADGRVIPKWLGVFETTEAAKAEAEERKFDDPPKRNGIHDYKSKWAKKR